MFYGFSSVFQRRFSYAVFGWNFPRCFFIDDFFRDMFCNLPWAIDIRVKEGVFVFLGLYSGRLTNGDFFLELFSFLEVTTFGRVKITVFCFRFTSFMLQPIL